MAEGPPGGAVLIARAMQDSEVWGMPPQYLKLWLYLLINARWDKRPHRIGPVTVGYGQVVKSYRKIADECQYTENRQVQAWSTSQVKRVLAWLEERGMVETLGTELGTLITVCNFKRYQDFQTYAAELGTGLGTTKEHLGTPPLGTTWNGQKASSGNASGDSGEELGTPEKEEPRNNRKQRKQLETDNKKKLTPKPPSKAERWEAEFESSFWPRYPNRKGNRGKKQALRAWNGRMRDGIEPETMIEAVKRYHRFCEVDGKIGTTFVLMASTFLGDPDNFDNPWTPPTKDEKPAPKRADPPSPDSEAARVRSEKPQAPLAGRTNSLTLVGKDTTESEERRQWIERWKNQHADEIDRLRDEAIDRIGMALSAFGKRPEVARKLIDTKVDEIIWTEKLEGAA